ncbi:MAG TPA: sugar ABC transporter permease [Epulopiscium sp.]|nr:sugar ABC transporter permease [Candidatus Epulonipiscium sp.]
MDRFKQLMKSNIRQYGMGIALVSIVILFQILTGGILLKPLNVSNLILQNSYILVLAIGMLLVIITGNVDLSVGSVVAFVGAISGMLMVNLKVPVVIAVIISLLIGALVGAWQGYWIAYVKIPAFIVTLAGMLVFRGLTLVILQGKTLAPFPEAFQAISSGFTPDIFGGSNLHITTILVGIIFSVIYIWMELDNRKKKIKYNFDTLPIQFLIAKLAIIILAINLLTFSLASYKGIPNVLVLLAALVVVYTFIANKTIPGRHIYALGGNEKAAKLSGIKTEKVMFWVYVNMGLLSALAGMVFTGRLNAATPKAGSGFELDAIAACYIGGASASGGIGTVIGAIIGGLVMGVLNNGMSIIGVGIDWQQTIKGMVLLAAVAFDVYTKSKSKK